MRKRIMALIVGLAAMSMMGFTAVSASAATGPKPIVYNSIPKNLAGNYPSQPFQAQQTSEFGDIVSFAPGTTSNLKQVTLVMSSWACQAGTWNGGDCATTPGARFTVPITLTVYNVAGANSLGTVIASSTKNFKIPYRPSADPTNCPATPEKYRATDGTCYNGKAVRISFSFGGQTLPANAIWGVTYNTSGYGYSPKGYGNPCNSTVQGCPYDSLNVAAGATAPTVGTDQDLNGVFLNSATPAVYCDGGTGGTNTFRRDTPCWTGFNPMIRFKVFTF
jgi:hypothetical protein